MLRFEWDEAKDRANQRKHGISFAEAQSVFFDDEAIEYADPVHSHDEDRFLMLGRSFKLHVLVVCHCHRESSTAIRIISARRATSKERNWYRTGRTK